jgi:CRISPR-associated protein Csx14
MVPWGAYFPALQALSRPARPSAPLLDPVEAAHCAAVWSQLTDRQRDVLRTLAEGLHPQDAAEELCITLKTLDSHKTEILAECRTAWNMPEDTRLTYHFLREKFGAWITIYARL